MGIRRAEISDGGVVGVTITCSTCDGTGELHEEYPFPTSLINSALDRISIVRQRLHDENAGGPPDVGEREMVALALMTAVERGFIEPAPRVPDVPTMTGVWEMSQADLYAHLRAHHGFAGTGLDNYTHEALRYLHDEHEDYPHDRAPHPHVHEADPNEGVSEHITQRHVITDILLMSSRDLRIHLRNAHAIGLGETALAAMDHAALRYMHDDHPMYSQPKPGMAHVHEQGEDVPELVDALDMHIDDFRSHMTNFHDTTGSAIHHFRKMDTKRLLLLHKARHETGQMVEEHTHAASDHLWSYWHEPADPNDIDITEHTSHGVEYP